MPVRLSRNSEPVIAAIYCRISLAKMGDRTKVDDQEAQCREVCRQRGWAVGEVYKDSSRSAWQRNRKRDGWDALLEDAKTGRFGAIVSYWGDRLVRQPRDLEDLLDLRDIRQITVASVAGQYDFGNKDHRMMMRWEVARACNESDTISQRVSNHHALRRERGLVRAGGAGGRAYGFATDGVTQVPEECEIIREMAARVLRGETVGSIARGVSACGARTPTGRPFSHGTLKKMLMRPRYAGLMPDGESKGAWEPVLDRQTWERVGLMLETKAGTFDYASNARKWMLSGIATCGSCGEPLQVNSSKGRGGGRYVSGYMCRTGCRKVYRSAQHLDVYVSARVVRLLNDPRQPEGEARLADTAPEWTALSAERAETESLLADFGKSVGMARTLATRIAEIDARMAELREREAGDARSRLLGQYRGITAAQFADLPLDVRRALVAASYRVTVLPASGRGPGFRPQDVRLDPA